MCGKGTTRVRTAADQGWCCSKYIGRARLGSATSRRAERAHRLYVLCLCSVRVCGFICVTLHHFAVSFLLLALRVRALSRVRVCGWV